MSGRGTTTRMKAGSVTHEVERRGAGRPLLVLMSEEQLERDAAILDTLAKNFELIIPSPAGFGASERPDWIGNPDDLSYMCLDILDALDLNNVLVVGFSLGGWIAAEMASKSTQRISKLVLVDSYGIKVGGPLDRDVMDIWTSHPTKVGQAKWADPDKGHRDYSKMNDDELTVVARNLESFARFCWDPYMHNPKLPHRLHRINVPTLVIWGEKDGLVTTAYGEAYAKLIPGAKFTVVPGMGHFPHLEAPDAFLSAFNAFVH